MNTKNFFSWTLICLSIIFSACVTGPIKPTTEQLATADYGSPPIDQKIQIEKYFSLRLKDPDSVKYSGMTDPIKGYANAYDQGKWSVIYGYEILVYVNAKNSYGGYTGPKAYFFLFRNGKIANVMP